MVDRGSYNVIYPARFLVDAGGKLNQEDLKETSAFFGQEVKEKYNDAGVIHVQKHRLG
jgi:hypothetical protein